MSYTPGPWKFWDRGSDHANSMITDESSACGIARPIAAIREPGKGNVHLKEMRANARLIAAAPELLAACKRSLANFDNAVSFGLVSADSPVLTQLRAAIAKAEGSGQ